MTAETTIHPRLTEIITANAGNKLTEALSTGKMPSVSKSSQYR